MRGYQAHVAFLTDARMYINMGLQSILIGFLLQIMVLGMVTYYAFPSMTNVYTADTHEKLPNMVLLKYLTGIGNLTLADDLTIETELSPYAKGWPSLSLKYYRAVADYATNNAYDYYLGYLKLWVQRSFFAYVFSGLYLWFFLHKAKDMEKEKFIRGAKLTPLAELSAKLAREAAKNPLSSLKIGATRMPFTMEAKHMLILGASGSGKGVLLNQLIAQINDRKSRHAVGDRMIIYDPKGEFIAKQLQPNDLIFCPFDARSLKWNIFNEIEIEPDLEVLARSLFSPPSARDSYWYNCAADVFRTGLVYLKMKKTTSNKDLWDFFSKPLMDIQEAFETLPEGEQGALKHIQNADSASSSIISTLLERIQFFRYLTDVDGDFSFRRFIRDQVQDEGPQPNLYILNIAQYANLFKPLMTLAVDIMSRETLSLPDDPNRRLFFIIDELGTMNRMDSVIQLETVGRSKGACLVCSNQDLGRIEEEYGKANIKTFCNNFNTNITFRLREPETANFMSRAIGEKQIIKMSQSRQMSPTDVGDRKSLNEQERTERLVLATEFQALPDLTAIVNMAGFGVSRLIVPAIFYPERHPNFVMREFGDFAIMTPCPPEPITSDVPSKKPPDQKNDFQKLRL